MIYLYILILNCGNLANYESWGIRIFDTEHILTSILCTVCCLIRYWEVLILNEELWKFTWVPNFPRSARLLDFSLWSAFGRACRQRSSMKLFVEEVTSLVGNCLRTRFNLLSD